MLLHRVLNNTYTGRPCFIPWQEFDISYDAILDIRITVTTDKDIKLFLNHYSKTEDAIDLSIATSDGKIVATLNTTITSDIQQFPLNVTEPVVYGIITLNKTSTTEKSTKMLQLSPMCVVYQDNNIVVDTIKVDGVEYVVGLFSANCFNSAYIQTDSPTFSHLNLSYRDELIQQTSEIKVSGDIPDNYITTWDSLPIKYDEKEDVYYVEITLPEHILPYKQNGNTLYLVSTAKKICEYTTEIATYEPANIDNYVYPEKCPAYRLFVKASEIEESDSSLSTSKPEPPVINGLPPLVVEVTESTEAVPARKLDEWVYKPEAITTKLFEKDRLSWDAISIRHDNVMAATLKQDS